jgi:hypothetical protein
VARRARPARLLAAPPPAAARPARRAAPGAPPRAHRASPAGAPRRNAPASASSQQAPRLPSRAAWRLRRRLGGRDPQRASRQQGRRRGEPQQGAPLPRPFSSLISAMGGGIVPLPREARSTSTDRQLAARSASEQAPAARVRRRILGGRSAVARPHASDSRSRGAWGAEGAPPRAAGGRARSAASLGGSAAAACEKRRRPAPPRPLSRAESEPARRG